MTTYCRKLSREDVETSSILIGKRRWRDFPVPMSEFVVRIGQESFCTRILAEDCTCVPPTHQHYHLEAGHFIWRLDFNVGTILEVVRMDEHFVIRNG